MSYIIKVTSDECPPRYLQRLNGFMPPSLTPSAGLAAQFEESRAVEVLEKLKKAILKEKGGETVTAELEEVVEYGIHGFKKPPCESEPHTSDYIEGYGEPRSRFIFAGHSFNFYIRKSGNGKFLYAYNIDNGPFEATSEDGEAIFRAFCVACCEWGTKKIRQFKEKKNG